MPRWKEQLTGTHQGAWTFAIMTLLVIAAALYALGSRPPQSSDMPSAGSENSSRIAAVLRSRLRAAEERLQREIDRGAFPGAALAVGVSGQTIGRSALGKVGWTSGAEAVDPERTLYDLASLTKIIATTTAVMLLVEDGKMELDAPVSRYLPEFAGGEEDRVTLRHLLTHTSGLAAGANLRGESPRELRKHLVSIPIGMPPGSRVTYSDVGFVVLWAAAERAAGEPIPELLERRVYAPLGMQHTRFAPEVGCPRCAPTLRLEGGEPYLGGSYDYTARRLGGIAGNAGLFSTAHDLARFAAMIAGGGALGGVRVLKEKTIRTFLREQPDAGTRALGWALYCREGIVPDEKGCEEVYAVGHTGSTGTSLWIEPETGIWVVLLTNRVYEPRADIEMQEFRREIFEQVTGTHSPSPVLP